MYLFLTHVFFLLPTHNTICSKLTISYTLNLRMQNHYFLHDKYKSNSIFIYDGIISLSYHKYHHLRDNSLLYIWTWPTYWFISCLHSQSTHQIQWTMAFSTHANFQPSVISVKGVVTTTCRYLRNGYWVLYIDICNEAPYSRFIFILLLLFHRLDESGVGFFCKVL